ncbi:hypothetical protein E4U12_007990 [Claviceps purpurea]|nr:hypothetical protein E4U12_007990 [Claviceps purpurea]
MREKSEGTSLAESLTSQAHPNQRNGSGPSQFQESVEPETTASPQKSLTGRPQGNASCNPAGGRWSVLAGAATPAGT